MFAVKRTQQTMLSHTTRVTKKSKVWLYYSAL